MVSRSEALELIMQTINEYQRVLSEASESIQNPGVTNTLETYDLAGLYDDYHRAVSSTEALETSLTSLTNEGLAEMLTMCRELANAFSLQVTIPEGRLEVKEDSRWINNGRGIYIAKEGATLWGLAEEVYGDGRRWTEFVYGKDPKKLQIGDIVGEIQSNISDTDIEYALYGDVVNGQYGVLNDPILSQPTEYELKKLVNTGELSTLLKNNSNLLDPYTRAYADNSSLASLQNDLDNVKVMMGVDLVTTQSKLASLGINAGTNPEALTVRDTILVFYNMHTEANGRVRYKDDADLLGHEAIHVIQVKSAGSASAFVGRYITYSKIASSKQKHPYYGNEQEIAAYNFGPENALAENAGSLRYIDTIFYKNPRWYL